MTSINFSTPVVFNHPEKTFRESAIEWVDCYLTVGSKEAKITFLNLDSKSSGRVEITERSTSSFATALKIASWVLSFFILPGIALAAKYLLRKGYISAVTEKDTLTTTRLDGQVDSNLPNIQELLESDDGSNEPSQSLSISHISEHKNVHIDSIMGRISSPFNWGKHKMISRIEDTNLLIKIPKISELKNILYKNECIAFLISEATGLEAVPFTQIIERSFASKSDIQNLDELQENILKQQPALDFAILQRKIFSSSSSSESINVHSAHKTLLFNLIGGRSDNKRENSKVDENGNVWEIDNDMLCSKISNDTLNGHWLKNKADIWNTAISQELLDHILGIDENEIAEIQNNKAYRKFQEIRRKNQNYYFKSKHIKKCNLQSSLCRRERSNHLRYFT